MFLQNTRRDELKKELNRTKDSIISDDKNKSESKRGYWVGEKISY